MQKGRQTHTINDPPASFKQIKSCSQSRGTHHNEQNSVISKKKKNEEIEKKKDKHIVTYLPQSEDSP